MKPLKVFRDLLHRWMRSTDGKNWEIDYVFHVAFGVFHIYLQWIYGIGKRIELLWNDRL